MMFIIQDKLNTHTHILTAHNISHHSQNLNTHTHMIYIHTHKCALVADRLWMGVFDMFCDDFHTLGVLQISTGQRPAARGRWNDLCTDASVLASELVASLAHLIIT